MKTASAPSAEAIAAEYERINRALSDPTISDEQYGQLYAARSAMDWMRNRYVASPTEDVLSNHIDRLVAARWMMMRILAWK